MAIRRRVTRNFFRARKKWATTSVNFCVRPNSINNLQEPRRPWQLGFPQVNWEVSLNVTLLAQGPDLPFSGGSPQGSNRLDVWPHRYVVKHMKHISDTSLFTNWNWPTEDGVVTFYFSLFCNLEYLYSLFQATIFLGTVQLYRKYVKRAIAASQGFSVGCASSVSYVSLRDIHRYWVGEKMDIWWVYETKLSLASINRSELWIILASDSACA